MIYVCIYICIQLEPSNQAWENNIWIHSQLQTTQLFLKVRHRRLAASGYSILDILPQHKFAAINPAYSATSGLQNIVQRSHKHPQFCLPSAKSFDLMLQPLQHCRHTHQWIFHSPLTPLRKQQQRVVELQALVLIWTMMTAIELLNLIYPVVKHNKQQTLDPNKLHLKKKN